jgi:hypothetical protein
METRTIPVGEQRTLEELLGLSLHERVDWVESEGELIAGRVGSTGSHLAGLLGAEWTDFEAAARSAHLVLLLTGRNMRSRLGSLECSAFTLVFWHICC